jgi:hypothetical protein
MTSPVTLGFSKAESATGMPNLNLTREPRPILKTPPIKASQHGIVFIGKASTDSDWVITQDMDASTPEVKSYEELILSSRPAFMFNRDVKNMSFSYRVSPNETSNIPGSLDFAFENTWLLLQRLSDEYSKGKIDIPEIVKRLGEPWNESLVVLALEIIGAHRPIGVGQISSQDEEKVLRKLAEIRGTPEAEKFNDEVWIKRAVIASQRIESIYVLLDDFPAIE